MRKLNLYPMAANVELAHPLKPAELGLKTPALDFLTDFNLTEPLVLEASVSAVEAREIMMRTHVRLNFIIDEHQHFIGIITAADLHERKIIQKVATGMKRTEILVTDFMQARKDLFALDFTEVSRASISDIVLLLKDYHQQHCLIVDHHDDRIRGIFSASDISRMLKLPINISDQSDFYRVFAAIA